jgi:hypothetical protein
MSRSIPLYSLLLFAVTCACIACGPPAQGDAQDPSQVTPELTQDVINERINDVAVFEVLPEGPPAGPIAWGFDEDEPKEITVVEKNFQDETHATIILDIKTRSSPRARNVRVLSGQMRTDWELRTGWVLRRWEIVNTENISMKYKDLPKSADGRESNKPDL